MIALVVTIFIVFLVGFMTLFLATGGSFADIATVLFPLVLFFCFMLSLYLIFDRRENSFFSQFYQPKTSKTWGGLNGGRLFNKHCDLNYNSLKGTITCREMPVDTNKYRTFRVVKSLEPIEEQWKMICDYFEESTTYDALVI